MPRPPLTRSPIHTVVTAYPARDAADDPAARTPLPGHVTCGAAVIDREGRAA
ncbi:hypothetical protein [Streptomyces sp. A1277]|uniref:hypothetical protein n=1 Tax=Streptomyces sp. A1277 TaxID=2563103 RepID=UPI0019D1C127|nr:hypothetical protein [Streptomyces sp. A1277]